MKEILKRYLLINLFIIMLIFTSSIYAATANISATKTTAYVGDSVSINVSINAAAWNLNVSGSGISSGNITGFNMEGTNQATTKSYKLNTSLVGTYTVYLKGDISDGTTDVTSDISKSVTVTVKAKPVTTPGTNTTSTKPSTGTTINKPTTSTVNKNISTNTTLSNNAYLKEFRVNQPGITPAFTKTTYNYAITVGEDVNRLNVTAVPEHSKAFATVTGNDNLKTGENVVTVKVTAQDKKTVKIYKILVTKTDEPIKSNAYLQNLIITNATLTPTFSSEVFEYDIGNIGAEIDSLDISAFPANEKAKVDIVGNDNFIVGENTIKIIVTSENTKMQKTYILKGNREETNSLVDAVQDESDIDKQKNDNYFKDTTSVMGVTLKENAAVILLYGFVWVEFIQVVYLYEKLKNFENKAGINEYNRIKNANKNEEKRK